MGKLLKLILPAMLCVALSLALIARGGGKKDEESSQAASSADNQSKAESSDTTSEASQPDETVHLAVADMPEGIEPSAAYTVTVKYGEDGEETAVPCYQAKVGKESVSYEGEGEITTDIMAFCYFESDFLEKVIITVTPSGEFENCVIRPLARNISFEEKDGSVTFELNKAAKLSVEFDDKIYTNLFIYADDLQTEEIKEGDTGVIYYGPGVHNAGQITLTSGQTLYLAPGAFVYGNVVAENAEDIAIKGRGILCGSQLTHRMDGTRTMLCTINNCSNVVINGVIFLDSPTWTLRLYCSDNVEVNNLKEICWYFNSDGIDVCSGNNIQIKNCFLRNYDDNVSIKAYESKDSTNIKVTDCVFWADCAHNMLVGPEAKEADYENKYSEITFRNITVLEQNEKSDFYKGVMAITCADNAVFDKITWDSIKIERMSNGAVINFRFSDDYGTYMGKSISGVSIINVNCAATPARGDSILGLAENPIHDISITNYVVNGKKISLNDHNFTGDFGYIDALNIDGDERRVTNTFEELGNPPYVKIEAAAQGTGTLQFTLNPEIFEDGKTYTITTVAKFQDIDASVGALPSAGLGFVNYYVYKPDGSLDFFKDFAQCTAGSVDWRRYTDSFEIPANHGVVTISIGLWEATGFVYCSEIELKDSSGNIVLYEDFYFGIDGGEWKVTSEAKSIEVITEEEQ